MRNQQEAEKTSPYNIVLLGDVKSGKTALVSQYLFNNIASLYKPTVEDSYRTLARLPDGRYKTVNIIDTAGSMEFPAMRELRIRSATAIIIVYSVESVESIKTASALKRQVQELRGYDGIPINVIGNRRSLNLNTFQLQIPTGVMEDSSCEHSYVDMTDSEQCSSVFKSVINKCYETNTWKVEVWEMTKKKSDEANKQPTKKKGKFIRMFSIRRSKSRPKLNSKSAAPNSRSIQSMP